MNSNDYELVYSSDGSGKNLVSKKSKTQRKNPRKDQAKYQDIIPKDCSLKLSLSKKGRGGKTVSLISELPNNPPYFQKLTKKIKRQLGTGGTWKKDSIEVQGEHLEKLRELLQSLGFKTRG